MQGVLCHATTTTTTRSRQVASQYGCPDLVVTSYHHSYRKPRHFPPNLTPPTAGHSVLTPLLSSASNSPFLLLEPEVEKHAASSSFMLSPGSKQTLVPTMLYFFFFFSKRISLCITSSLYKTLLNTTYNQ